eukprot:2888758-Pleurochrysis_carterae.AAC.2
MGARPGGAAAPTRTTTDAGNEDAPSAVGDSPGRDHPTGGERRRHGRSRGRDRSGRRRRQRQEGRLRRRWSDGWPRGGARRRGGRRGRHGRR